jgi:hypothetical protein
MPRVCYVEHNFQQSSLDTIDQANAIIHEYLEQGFSLTLRQLYYQMVARDLIPNSMRSYKRLGSILNDARLAGVVDWLAIEDRTRGLVGNTHWDGPDEIIEAAVQSYAIDKWDGQPHRVEVWVEKDALSGVIARACVPLDVDYFSCRGYTSASEMWRAARRLRRYYDRGQIPVVIHLGDHDPSGIDMTRDIAERLSLFSDLYIEVDRIALNMDQVEEYDPPPNPAKITDSRSDGYIMRFGGQSWELDALQPAMLRDLIEDAVLQYRDDDLWEAAVAVEARDRAALRDAANKLSSAS